MLGSPFRDSINSAGGKDELREPVALVWAGLVVREGQEWRRVTWRVREDCKAKLCLRENTRAAPEGGRADGSRDREEGGSKRRGRRANGLGQSQPWCEPACGSPRERKGVG